MSSGIFILPQEILLYVLSFLRFNEIATFGKTNTILNSLTKNDSLWKEQFFIHFPHLFEKASAQKDVKWYEKFQEAQKTEYKDAENKDIDATLKEFCYLIKTCNLKG